MPRGNQTPAIQRAKEDLEKSEQSFGKQFGIDLFDLENPRSLINIVPQRLREAMLRPDLPRGWLEYPESNLMQLCEHHLDPRDYRLKLTFWDEYNRAQDENCMMNLERVCKGSVSVNYFYSTVLKNPHKLIFMLQPHAHYQVSVRELLQLSLSKMREVMTLPIVDGKGKPQLGVIKEMVKIFQIVDNRVQGGARQTVDINQKTLQMNVDARAMNPSEKEVSAIDLEIEKLQGQLAEKSQVVAEYAEVSYEDVVAMPPIKEDVNNDEDEDVA